MNNIITTLTNNLSTQPYAPNVAWNNSWVCVDGANFPLYAQASYITNLNNYTNGFVVINSTSPVSGNFSGIQTVTTTVITALTAKNGTIINSNSNLPNITFPANFEIKGSYSNIQLASGSVIAYIA
jgi:hypothetical protein